MRDRELSATDLYSLFLVFRRPFAVALDEPQQLPQVTIISALLLQQKKNKPPLRDVCSFSALLCLLHQSSDVQGPCKVLGDI